MFKRFININFSKNQQHAVNITASTINLLVTTLISFFLSPYIVSTIGVEANGFVTLANSFISYATLARTALNSMGSRFLMIAYYKGEDEKVERYYSSLFFADVVLAAALGIVGAICVWKLEYVLSIPTELVTDVKILFALIFLNFIISTIITVWSSATYIKNKLYLDSINSALNSIVRALMIAGLFFCLDSRTCFVGVGTLVGGLVNYALLFFCKKNLFPKLKAKTSNFSFSALRELLASGIWNSISSLGSVLIAGLDLLLANRLVGAVAMGVLSVAKTMPAFIDTLNETLANVFTPSLIMDYAKENKDEIVKTIKQSSKIISVICSLPLGFLFVYGNEFYSLWQPSQDAWQLYILSVITIFGRVFFTGMQPLFSVFTVVNKVRENSIVMIANGLISVTITCFLVTYTDLGIYAIAGVSVVCCFIKNVVYVIPFSAKYLGLRWTTFYHTLLPSIICFVLLCLLGFIERLVFIPNTWIELIIAGVVFAGAGLIITSSLVLSKQERQYLSKVILKKLKH